MDYEFFSGKDVLELKNFIPAEVLAGFESLEYRYALCGIDNQCLAGVAVFDAMPVTEICSIRVIEEYRGVLEFELLKNIIEICQNLNAEGIVYDIYDEDDPDFWAPILESTLFFEQDSNTLYRFSLKELADHKILKKVTAGGNIIALKDASNALLRQYSNKLIQKASYDHFLSGDFHPEISSLYVENNTIIGCLLIQDYGPKEGFSVEYVNTNGCDDSLAMLRMLKRSAEVALSYYPTTDIPGYILAMNDTSDKLIRELFPDAAAIDHCTTYARVL